MLHRRILLIVSIFIIAFSISDAAMCAELQWEWQNPYPQPFDLNAIWGNSGSDVFAVGDNGTIVHYDGNKWNVEIPVNAGETYVLYLSDWTQSPTGYSLDFSPSTALIYDTIRPEIGYINTNETSCGDTTIVVQFTEFVQCATTNEPSSS